VWGIKENSMALPRDQVSDGLLAELDRFEQLIRPLSDAEWTTASCCEGWTVGDIARHVVGSMADVAAGQLDGLGTPEVTAREVDERAGRSAEELADECATVRAAAAGLLPLFDDEAWAAAAPGGFDGTLGDGVEALWYDTWMHANDIRSSLGAAAEQGPALDGALSHVCFELRKRGAADEVVGDPFTWVLVATGRAEPSVIGDGAPINIYA
jgi:uncharacterized protein (TIGR03083 family)